MNKKVLGYSLISPAVLLALYILKLLAEYHWEAFVFIIGIPTILILFWAGMNLLEQANHEERKKLD